MTDSFNSFNLPSALMLSLERMHYATPTPIQAQAIPAALAGRDVLGSAQTGTGKTGAFAIPMIASLINNPAQCALVMTPTRELASQVLSVARDMIGRGKNNKEDFIKTALLIGGESMGKQHTQLRERPRLIVGTPGRINDHLRQNSKLLSNFSFLVLDEADRMLDMGFSGQIDEVLAKMSAERQTLMFSATFPPAIIRFSQNYLRNPVRVNVGQESRAHENINHTMTEVSNEEKFTALLAQLDQRQGTVIVFVKTKYGADKLADKLTKRNYEAGALHGGLRQGQRDRAVAAFRKQITRILVATDVAARGLDIPHVEHVINYDMPQVAEDYIHRIGRTARAGAKGEALALVTPNDRHLWRDVERLLDPSKQQQDTGERLRSAGKKKSYGKKFGAERRMSEKEGDERKARTGKPRDGFRKKSPNARKKGGFKPRRKAA